MTNDNKCFVFCSWQDECDLWWKRVQRSGSSVEGQYLLFSLPLKNNSSSCFLDRGASTCRANSPIKILVWSLWCGSRVGDTYGCSKRPLPLVRAHSFPSFWELEARNRRGMTRVTLAEADQTRARAYVSQYWDRDGGKGFSASITSAQFTVVATMGSECTPFS